MERQRAAVAGMYARAMGSPGEYADGPPRGRPDPRAPQRQPAPGDPARPWYPAGADPYSPPGEEPPARAPDRHAGARHAGTPPSRGGPPGVPPPAPASRPPAAAAASRTPVTAPDGRAPMPPPAGYAGPAPALPPRGAARPSPTLPPRGGHPGHSSGPYPAYPARTAPAAPGTAGAVPLSAPSAEEARPGSAATATRAARAGRHGTAWRRGPIRGYPPMPGQPGPVYPPGQFSSWNKPSLRASWLGANGGGADLESEPGYSALAISDPSADATTTQTWAAIEDSGAWSPPPLARDVSAHTDGEGFPRVGAGRHLGRSAPFVRAGQPAARSVRSRHRPVGCRPLAAGPVGVGRTAGCQRPARAGACRGRPGHRYRP
jgi:hypothetical protein